MYIIVDVVGVVPVALAIIMLYYIMMRFLYIIANVRRAAGSVKHLSVGLRLLIVTLIGCVEVF